MKSSNKSSIITGTILLALAAVFSICLLLQLLDFGIGGPGHNNVFYFIGNVLMTVYGFSSILIPTFLQIRNKTPKEEVLNSTWLFIMRISIEYV